MKTLEILKTLREDHTYDHIVSYDASMKEVKEAIAELEALQSIHEAQLKAKDERIKELEAEYLAELERLKRDLTAFSMLLDTPKDNK